MSKQEPEQEISEQSSGTASTSATVSSTTDELHFQPSGTIKDQNTATTGTSVESDPPQLLSMSEITDTITNKLNDMLMEMNKTDKDMNKMFNSIEKKLDSLQSSVSK